MSRPARSRLFALRRRFGQTRWARAVRRRQRSRLRVPRAQSPSPALLRTFPGDDRLPPELRDDRLLADALAWAERRGQRPREPTTTPHARTSQPRRIANVLFVSHTDFSGNSAWHVLGIATELRERGLEPMIAIPDDLETAREAGDRGFPIVALERVLAEGAPFPDGRGPDLVHAFTPRELVREATSAIVAGTDRAYVIHLEDNDGAILSAELGGAGPDELARLPAAALDPLVGRSRVHPLRGRRFVERAAGASVVTDRLLELVPPGMPSAVVKPGFDPAVLEPQRGRTDVRAELGLDDEEFAIAYTGSVHTANAADVRSLYAAVAALRDDGHRVVLVKTGWDGPEAAELPQVGRGIRNLGHVARSFIPSLLGAADALVQPGAPGDFDDYRFPAKLPDFLASGRPVILPRANIGLELRDGHDALLLERGTTEELFGAILRLRDDPGLAEAVGRRGREFALRELRWSKSADAVRALYGEVAGLEPRILPRRALEIDPPVKLVALVSERPGAAEAREARAHGIYDFCREPQGAASRVEPPAAPATAYDLDTTMHERLAAPLPAHDWFRSLAFPAMGALREAYELWLRKLVLQTLARADAQEPWIYVVPGEDRAAWLAATRAAVVEGVRQFYSSQGLDVSRRALERAFSLE